VFPLSGRRLQSVDLYYSMSDRTLGIGHCINLLEDELQGPLIRNDVQALGEVSPLFWLTVSDESAIHLSSKRGDKTTLGRAAVALAPDGSGGWGTRGRQAEGVRAAEGVILCGPFLLETLRPGSRSCTAPSKVLTSSSSEKHTLSPGMSPSRSGTSPVRY
jgi:hypothetical protein